METSTVIPEPDDKGRKIRKIAVDFCVSLAICALLMGLAIFRDDHPSIRAVILKWNAFEHFGAEYHNIALALRDGRGFADPFGPRTGPTAWMPPLFPVLQAAVLWFTDDNLEELKFCLMSLSCIAHAFTGFTVLTFARNAGYWKTGLCCFLAMLCLHFHFSFQLMHDPWFVSIWINLILLAAMQSYHKGDQRSHIFCWGVLGGLSALANPALTVVWGGLTLRGRTKAYIPLCQTLLVALAVVSPWIVRNCVAFSAFVPMKSNLGYELWQAQLVDNDGVVDNDSFSTHPNSTKNVIDFVASNEVDVARKKGRLFFSDVQQHPEEYVKRVWNRFVAATYVRVDAQPSVIKPLWMLTPEGVLWSAPMHAILLIVICGVKPKAKIVWNVVWVYLAFLAPYILVSYYDRYGTCLVSVKAILCTYGIAVLFGQLTTDSDHPHGVPDVSGTNLQHRL